MLNSIWKWWAGVQIKGRLSREVRHLWNWMSKEQIARVYVNPCLQLWETGMSAREAVRAWTRFYQRVATHLESVGEPDFRTMREVAKCVERFGFAALDDIFDDWRKNFDATLSQERLERERFEQRKRQLRESIEGRLDPNDRSNSWLVDEYLNDCLRAHARGITVDEAIEQCWEIHLIRSEVASRVESDCHRLIDDSLLERMKQLQAEGRPWTTRKIPDQSYDESITAGCQYPVGCSYASGCCDPEGCNRVAEVRRVEVPAKLEVTVLDVASK